MNNNSIRLHPTLGVNPKLTFCRKCGGDVNELILIGANDSVRECDHCKIKLIGYGPNQICEACHIGHSSERIRRVEEYEKLPSNSLCDKCEIEAKEHKALVEMGGVYFKCKECNKTGVIKSSAFATAVRNSANVKIPKPVGVEFNKCIEHNPK